MSMYQGSARFTKEQVIFMCQVAIAAALDRIESRLPPCVPADEYHETRDSALEWVHAATETAGMALAIVYAQLNHEGDGLAICDAMANAGLLGAVEGFVKARLEDPNAPVPDSRKLAVKFVNKTFGEVWFAE